jgi:hypothetical protein
MDHLECLPLNLTYKASQWLDHISGPGRMYFLLLHYTETEKYNVKSKLYLYHDQIKTDTVQ